MQKNIHFNSTYAIGVKANFPDIKLVAWADQYTDECQKLYEGIRTAVGWVDDWCKKTVQRDVLIPFHFPPGGSEDKPYRVDANSALCQVVLDDAVTSGDPYRLGQALHLLQDSFSHQNWTGWNEKYNECYWFGVFPCLMPNVGHTNMGLAPDIINATWYDPRTKETIKNISRARLALAETCEILGLGRKMCLFDDFLKSDYDEGKKMLACWCGDNTQFSDIKATKKMKHHFAEAAKIQLNIVKEYVKEIG